MKYNNNGDEEVMVGVDGPGWGWRRLFVWEEKQVEGCISLLGNVVLEIICL